MANIGIFKKTGNGFHGEIVTLSLQAKDVRLIPETNGSNENAPSHRAFVGRAEIGAAWSKRSGEGRDYLSVKLDDPSFNAPIYANLFEDERRGDLHTHLVPRPQNQRRLRNPEVPARYRAGHFRKSADRPHQRLSNGASPVRRRGSLRLP